MFGRIIAAWESAQIRGTKRKAEEALQRATDAPRTLPKAQHLNILRALTRSQGAVQNDRIPAQCLIEPKVAELEDGELVPERLCEIDTKDEARGETLPYAQIAADGTLKFRKSGHFVGSEPANSEEYGRKFRVFALLWEMLRLQYPTKPQLKYISTDTWDDHVDYILGETVVGVKIRLPGSTMAYSPTWAIVMEYDFQVRKEVYRLVNGTGCSIVEALPVARKDSEIRQRYFHDPTSLAAGTAAAHMAMASSSSSSQSPRIATANQDGPAGQYAAELQRLRTL